MSWKVCVCTSDGVNINQHFGRCEESHIYSIDGSGKVTLLEKRCLQTIDNGCAQGDYLLEKVKRIADCDYVLCEKIGNRLMRVLLVYGIDVLEHKGNIRDALSKLALYLARVRPNYQSKQIKA